MHNKAAWETFCHGDRRQVAFTAVFRQDKKENFQPVDGEAVLGKIRGFELSSWNFIGQILKSFATMVPWRKTSWWPSPRRSRTDRSETTINSGDMAGILMIAVQSLEKRTAS